MIGTAISWLLLPLAGAALLATALPALPLDTWWVRILDYPRLQVLIVMAALLLATLLAIRLLPRRRLVCSLALVLLVVGIGWDSVLLAPYVLPPILGWPGVAVAAGSCPAGNRLRVLEANVQMTNKQDHRLLEMVRAADPDIAWFQETDAWWEGELSALGDIMPHGVAQAQPNYFGVHLFSRLPLTDPQVRNLTGSRNPSVFTSVTLPGGGMVKIHAVHPRPPQVAQGTAERDAQLMAAALDARGDTARHVLLGDLNAVPWEQAVRRTAEIGNFRDPRAGRGLFITWNAHDTLAKWPLDHILPGPGLTLAALRVLPAFGSDHHPLLAEFCLDPSWTPAAPPPLAPDELKAVQATIQAGQGRAASPASKTPAGSDAGPGQ